jgi:hypothetical protein
MVADTLGIVHGGDLPKEFADEINWLGRAGIPALVLGLILCRWLVTPMRAPFAVRKVVRRPFALHEMRELRVGAGNGLEDERV